MPTAPATAGVWPTFRTLRPYPRVLTCWGNVCKVMGVDFREEGSIGRFSLFVVWSHLSPTSMGASSIAFWKRPTERILDLGSSWLRIIIKWYAYICNFKVRGLVWILNYQYIVVVGSCGSILNYQCIVVNYGSILYSVLYCLVNEQCYVCAKLR